MLHKIYSLKKIQKEKKLMQKRRQRSGIKGKQIEIPVRNAVLKCLSYQGKTKPELADYKIVEVHGGGFMYNTAWDDDDFCAYIHEKTGIPVISCDYRLAPEYPYPFGLQDVCDCVRAASEHAKIILWGHSAGANLAAGAAAQMLQDHADWLPKLMILDYPYMDVWKNASEREEIPSSVPGSMMDTFAFYYAQKEKRMDPFISPVKMSQEKLSGMPDTFLLLCGRDNLNAGGSQYGDLLRSAGCSVDTCHVEKAYHGFIENFFNYRQIPVLTKLQITEVQKKLAIQSVNEICHWIEEQIRQKK